VSKADTVIILNTERALAQYQSRDMNFKFGEYKTADVWCILHGHAVSPKFWVVFMMFIVTHRRCRRWAFRRLRQAGRGKLRAFG